MGGAAVLAILGATAVLYLRYRKGPQVSISATLTET